MKIVTDVTKETTVSITSDTNANVTFSISITLLQRLPLALTNSNLTSVTSVPDVTDGTSVTTIQTPFERKE